MPAALSVPLRHVIHRRFRRGESVSEIAAALALSERTVRHLLQRFRHSGAEAVRPDYPRCGVRRSSTQQTICDAAVQLKREHPGWGAGLIRVVLAESLPKRSLPSERTLLRWFAQAGLAPAPRGRPPGSNRHRAEQPHEVWQMDATEQVRLCDGQRVSWLRIVDEKSGAAL